MNGDELISIDPLQLQFPFECKMQISCSLQLLNKTDNYVAFKYEIIKVLTCLSMREYEIRTEVKATTPKKYGVRPNNGLVLPRSTVTVIVTMQAQKEAPADMNCKDKFLVQSVTAPPGSTPEDINHKMFDKEMGNCVEECKVRVVYVSPPRPPSPGLKELTDLSLNKIQFSLIQDMSGDALISIDPLQIQFPFELKKQISCSFQLLNKTDNHVAFKVKTTAPKKYCVRPNNGLVLPRSTVTVIVIMQAQKEAPGDMTCKDKFLVQSVIAPPGSTAKDISREMFNEMGNCVEEFKLRVVYVSPPSPPSPGLKELTDLSLNKIQFSSIKDMSGNELISIDPLQLQFPFELKKKITCSFKLLNKTDNHVAFKVKTTSYKNYCVRPNKGVLLPRSTISVTVTMQAQREAPVDMECKNKFLVEGVIVPPGSTQMDIIPEMFNKEMGNHVEVCKFRAVYISPPKPSSDVPDEFKAVPDESKVEDSKADTFVKSFSRKYNYVWNQFFLSTSDRSPETYDDLETPLISR